MIIEHPQDRRARRTQDAIIAAAVSLILEKGADALTIRDITERADYNRGTFYLHFPGKPELLQFLLEDFLQGLGQAYASPYANLTEVDMTGLLPSTMPVFEYIENHQDQFKALMTMHGDMALRINNVFRDYLTQDFILVTEDSEQVINYDIMLSYLVSATVGVIMHWAEVGFKYSAHYMGEQLTALINIKPTRLLIEPGQKGRMMNERMFSD
ncbi:MULTISPECIES: TetR/AcrR family transcriptional regulator [Paenibacillus]|uniref:TetR/AcrR family transcriptional regulator n=1 Tax=Paenibacillus cucumis (ex Kampfer et al. 2016) TaxID=1776858 RepID=A0ABS7KNM1_9BACL|nr:MULTISPECIES: TetR/AcrR family transcriptional regulator [Paenibacillus]MBY0205526.1 TetR/AcrR family transcriptional regulator [Paenibacillus cucumis (ex Kampfer et al. 2016)]MCM3135668.1 TetR/AcrR family transcriptional regulator [Paenibacillus polysaccharolyticus]MDP9700221.1 AcrR family transcriptional regulator [Paenibacillus intestini]